MVNGHKAIINNRIGICPQDEVKIRMKMYLRLFPFIVEGAGHEESKDCSYSKFMYVRLRISI